MGMGVVRVSFPQCTQNAKRDDDGDVRISPVLQILVCGNGRGEDNLVGEGQGALHST